MARPRINTDSSNAESPNAGLDLEGFDYNNLTGDNWKKYKEIEESLLFGKKYDFEVWKATAELEFEFDRKTGEKTQIVAGIKLNSAKPIQITRISALQALEINKHISHMTGNEYVATSKYLLLKKHEQVKEEA